MTPATQGILDGALALPAEDRLELAVILLDTIGDGRSQADIDAAWRAEIHRRLEAVRAGQATLIASEVVERELDELVTPSDLR